MCRGIHVFVAAPDDESCRRLRVAAGAEAEVVATATSADALDELSVDDQFDAAVIDGRVKDATKMIATLTRHVPGVAVVWVGENVPASTHATVAPERVMQDLPKAIARALSSRR